MGFPHHNWELAGVTPLENYRVLSRAFLYREDVCHFEYPRGKKASFSCQSLTDLVLTIRLSRIGKKKKPFYRVVVIERTRPRDGRVKEAVGTYDPLKKPAELKLDAERIKYWMGLGAQPSDTVRSFLRQQKIA